MQTDTLDAVIVYAKMFAHSKKMPEVLASHVLYALASVNNEAKKYLDEFGLTAARLEPKEIGRIGTAAESDEVKTVRQYAARLAYELGNKNVNCVHVLMALLAYKETYAYGKIVYLLDKQEKTPDDLYDRILEELPNREKIAAFIRGGDKLNLRMTESSKRERPVISPVAEDSVGPEKDVVMEHAFKDGASEIVPFTEDLTAKALVGGIDPVIGRETETERVIQTLTRRTKNNPVLVGEAGVGKTAVVEGLALAIAEDRVPSELQGKRLIELDIAGMVAGTRYRGDFEERLTNFVSQVIARGDVILFIDEIHNLVGAGSSKDGSMGASEILKPALARGELRVIGATTTREYRQYIEKDPALERRFQPIIVDEPDEETAIKILKGVKSKYEKHHGVEITDEAIVTAVQLSVRYITDRSLPDKAFDIVDEACSKLKISTYSVPPRLVELANQLNLLKRKLAVAESPNGDAGEINEIKKRYDELYFEYEYAQNEYEELKGYKCKLTSKDVRAVVSQMTGVPVSELSRAERDKLVHLEEELSKRVVGQKQAVQAVSKAVRRQRAGLKDPNRPIGSFIFVGPTGVGKTELAKALSECLFGSTSEVIRIDMSEYMDKQSAAKLIGAPPGYVGYEESGYLTQKVKSKPYSVVLFDEIEKAHPDVFNLLLQILDEGRLTDSHGKTVDFRNTVIILTSNIGLSEAGSGAIGFATRDSYSTMRESIERSLKKFFRPEFLNRLDEIIVFDYLSEEETLKITELLCFSLYKRIRGLINLKFRDKAIKKLAQEGYDKAYGARPLKRAIQRDVEDPLAEKLISGEIKKGDSVMVDIFGDEIVFKKIQ